jgi:hypothetical protein
MIIGALLEHVCCRRRLKAPQSSGFRHPVCIFSARAPAVPPLPAECNRGLILVHCPIRPEGVARGSTKPMTNKCEKSPRQCVMLAFISWHELPFTIHGDFRGCFARDASIYFLDVSLTVVGNEAELLQSSFRWVGPFPIHSLLGSSFSTKLEACKQATS